MRRAIALTAACCLIVLAWSSALAANGARHASAVVRNAAGAVLGTARFVQDATGVVHVNLHVKGLTPGLHGIHVHAVGACTPDFLAAGGHHNPTGNQHGLENPNGPHAGDLPNLTVEANGTATYQATNALVTLGPGANSLLDADGSALVIHADPDDEATDPTGNSGGRIACGVVARG